MSIKEIETRLGQIGAILEEKSTTLSENELDAFEKEVAELCEQRTNLIATSEKRTKLLADIAENNVATKKLRVFSDNSKEKTDGNIKNTAEYRKAFMEYVVRKTPLPEEYRNNAITYTSDAGAAIPTIVLDSIVEKLETAGNILSIVTQTHHKAGVEIPVSTVKATATWVNEGAGSDTQKKTIGKVSFTYHKLRCAVAVSIETDTMSIAAFEKSLAEGISTAMVKTIEAAIVNGTGTGQPKGILSETPVTGQKVESVAPSFTDLINAESAIPEEYENEAVYCMNKRTFLQYACLLDEVGQPIGKTNFLGSGKIERYLLGRPVEVSENVTAYSATAATGTVFAFIFKFSDYVLNMPLDITVKKYEDNVTDDIVTKAVALVDGKVVDKNSLVVIAKANA